MFPITYNFILKKIFCIFFTGIVIKLMDDYLDQNYDKLFKENSLIDKIDKGIVPYTLLIFSFACILDIKTAVSLFLASYIIGMFSNLYGYMPTGLYGYQESIIVFFVSVLFLKGELISSLFIIISIQLLDDYIDYKKDFSKHNLAFVFGKFECLLLAIIFFFISLYFDYLKSILSFLSAFAIVYIIKLWESSKGDAADNAY